ncbi:Signal transduction histidine kinase [Actinopolyspora alba]|uniref:Signal transduction histidine kinase n=2 Tax=Actinopolyspora alba TaxID=673379 RepID=A0A1I2C9W6_9ACTN|nr:Signal transduction histidine kinase [Actinopolyspora alba]
MGSTTSDSTDGHRNRTLWPRMWRTLTTTGESPHTTTNRNGQLEAVPDGRIPLWRAHNGLRVMTLIYAFAWFLVMLPDYREPVLGSAIMASMVAWTAFTIWRYSKPSGRTKRLVLLDQFVTTGLFGLCYFVLTEHQLEQGLPTVVTMWHASMVTAAAVRCGMPGGFVSGAAAAAANFAMRGYIDSNMWMDTALHLVIGLLLGLASETAKHSTRRLARALRAEAATAERERLARDIHDSVLQVLARVRRRGGELGGEAAELATMAGEQETALRTLVSTGPAERGGTSTDLAARLRAFEGTGVNVSVPATEVTLPAETITALCSVTGEALQNVAEHAGPEAHAWILLEDLGSEIVLSVRDNGPGIPEGRLEEAAAAGRMGVAQSIRGRVESLGGTVTLDTSLGEGTEWEIHLTRTDSRDRTVHSGGRERGNY